ncbi:MAG: hypothetical protein LBS60_12570 [Deltaproteobacteria bacterium]|jgi:hypothetical protein|nr:hypothetical protein [Deltaproteobacteria bacterium]
MAHLINNIRHTHRPGLIMVFVIVVMMLASLIGLMVLTRARAEVANSGQRRRGLEAFNSADSAAKLANLIGRVILHPVLGDPEQLIASSVTGTSSGPNQPLTIVLNNDRLEMSKLMEDSEIFDYMGRYLDAGLSHSSGAKQPHVTFKIGDEVVAQAAISVANDNVIGAGYSLNGGDQYDQVGGVNLPVDMVITVHGEKNSPGPNGPVVTESIITTIMREYM